MPSARENYFSRKWGTISMCGLYLPLRGSFFNIKYPTEQPRFYQTSLKAISDLCSTDPPMLGVPPLYFPNKLRLHVEKFFANHFERFILPILKTNPNTLSKNFYRQWESQAYFRRYLGTLFAVLDETLMDTPRPGGGVYIDTVADASWEVYQGIVIQPVHRQMRHRLVKKFALRVFFRLMMDDTDSTTGDIINFFRDTFDSTPFPIDSTSKLRSQPIYRQMILASGRRVGLMTFSNIVDRCTFAENINAHMFFGPSITRTLCRDTKFVFYNVHLPVIFEKYEKRYITWIKKANERRLTTVNRVLSQNVSLSRKASGLFASAFVEHLAEGLKLPNNVSNQGQDQAANPIHYFCGSSQDTEPKGLENETDKVSFIGDMLAAFQKSHKKFSPILYTSLLGNRFQESIDHVISKPCKNCSLPDELASLFLSFFRSEPYESERCDELSSQRRLFLQHYSRVPVLRKAYYDVIEKMMVERRIDISEPERLVLPQTSSVGLVDSGEQMLRDLEKSRKMFTSFSDSRLSRILQRRANAGVDFMPFFFKKLGDDNHIGSTISIPGALNVYHHYFERFLRTQDRKKRVTWSTRLGNVTVRTSVFSNKPDHDTEIQLNVDQFSVLDMFSQSNTWTVGDMKKNLIEMNIDRSSYERAINDLKCILLSMTEGNYPLLEASGRGRLFLDTDVISLNTSLALKRSSINIPRPDYHASFQAGQAVEVVSFPKRLYVEAAIVKIMKSERTMRKAELFKAVSESCSPYGNVDQIVFKEALKRMQTQELIKSVGGKGSVFKYLP